MVDQPCWCASGWKEHGPSTVDTFWVMTKSRLTGRRQECSYIVGAGAVAVESRTAEVE